MKFDINEYLISMYSSLPQEDDEAEDDEDDEDDDDDRLDVLGSFITSLILSNDILLHGDIRSVSSPVEEHDPVSQRPFRIDECNDVVVVVVVAVVVVVVEMFASSSIMLSIII